MGVTVEVKRQYGGADKIESELTLVDNKLESCFQITDYNGKWNTGAKLITDIGAIVESEPNLWAINERPSMFTVQGKGCSGAELSCDIEMFPNHYYTVEGKLNMFQEWVKSVNKAWEDWGQKIFDLTPVSLKPKLTEPAGTFSANWGWKENSDWRAYFDVAASFGLNPVFGVEIEISLSFVKLAMTSAGIPPNLTNITAEHLADLSVFGKAGCKGTLSGNPQGKFFTDGSKELTGEGELIIEGGVKLGIRGKIGSKYIVSAELTLSGETNVIGKNLLDLNSQGIFAETSIMLDPLKAIAKVEVKYLVIFGHIDEKKWTPFEATELYKSGPNKLIPAD